MANPFNDDLGVALSSCLINTTDEYIDEDEESEEEYFNCLGNEGKSDDLACPFCAEDFDVLGLCCHIDSDHRMDVKLGICPVCAAKVGVRMTSHVITQHEDVLKALCLKNLRSTRSRSAIFLMRRDLQEKYLHIIKDSQLVDSSRGKEVDSMLLSFVNNPQPKQTTPESTKGASLPKVSLLGASPKDDSSERILEARISDKNSEMAKKCEFLQGILLSTFLDDL